MLEGQLLRLDRTDGGVLQALDQLAERVPGDDHVGVRHDAELGVVLGREAVLRAAVPEVLAEGHVVERGEVRRRPAPALEQGRVDGRRR